MTLNLILLYEELYVIMDGLIQILKLHAMNYIKVNLVIGLEVNNLPYRIFFWMMLDEVVQKNFLKSVL